MRIDTIVDRVRSICIGAPFGLTEAERWDTFEAQPDTNIDRVFRIPPPASQSVIGEFGFVEDRVDTMQVWIARKHQQDFPAVRRALLQDMHSLTSAVVRDGAQTSGEYAVLDEGRGHSIGEENLSAQDYVTLRVSWPINYEIQL